MIRAFSFPLGRFVVLSALYCRGTVGMSMKHLYQVVGERAGKLDLVLSVELLKELVLAFYSFIAEWPRCLVPLLLYRGRGSSIPPVN
jgi:hypothetical protein